MSEAVSRLLELFSAVSQGYCLQYFYGSFLESRVHNRRANGYAVIGLYGLLRFVAGAFMPQDTGGFGIFIRIVLAACMAALVSSVFYKAKVRLEIFLTIVFLAVGEISVFLAYTFGQAGEGLVSFWGWCMERGYIVSPQTLSAFVYATVAGTNAGVFFVSALIMYYALKSVVWVFQEKSARICNKELLFLAAPSFTGVLICSLLRAILLTMEDGVPKQIYRKYPPLAFLVPAILILSLFSIVYGVKLFQDMACWNLEKNSRIILERQVSGLQGHIGEMERIYSGIRGMKHDMKNTLSVILQLAAGKGENWEKELQAYLYELNRTMDQLEFQFKTGNTVVDTLLNMKYHEAIQTVPDLQMDVERLQFPEKLLVQSYDIGIILGNALDNAMEACRKLKGKEPDAEAFIRISSFQKNGLLFLKMENSFDGLLVRSKQKEFPVTEKADRESHGIGLMNMKRTTERYQGAMDYKVKGKVFLLSVMMKNEKPPE